MTEEQLQLIEARSSAAQPFDSSHSLEAVCESMRDVPALITEIRRLRTLVDESEMIRCFRSITKSLGIRVDDMIRMEGEVKQLDDTIRRLHKALTLYGNHLSFCGQGHCSANPCTCGFTETLINQ